jgi:hypothetical protein
MKTALQTALARIAPSISIVTLWEHDPDGQREWRELARPGGCFADEEPEDWTCWQSEIQASAVSGGDLVTASAYLGGTWQEAGGNPAESNPDISGYERQMTVDALRDLARTLPESAPVQLEITAALAHLCLA